MPRGIKCTDDADASSDAFFLSGAHLTSQCRPPREEQPCSLSRQGAARAPRRLQGALQQAGTDSERFLNPGKFCC